MDLQTAVAVSLLPTGRCRAARIYKELREQHPVATVEVTAAVLGLTAADATVASRGADALLAAGVARGIVPVPWFDGRYPSLLNSTVDPPPVLWCRGCLEVLSRPVVAVVGSRVATPYALLVAERLSGELAAAGVTVASGLARGVDSAAHRGCLAAAGVTVAVLGSGLDRVYPPEHAELAASIADKGLVMSELGPGADPLPEHFPLRNRIISGISLGVVVVEASDKSGSLITARCAAEQGRDVMVVPGSVLSGRNRGSHALIRDGAKIVETVGDILEDLGWPSAVAAPGECNRLTGDDLLERMAPGEPYSLDDLVALTGLPSSRLLPRLLSLELGAKVVPGRAGTFTRTG